ncbi:hypothetical protein ADICYQ_4147 [Cyclobacterium qasimii M12-11B]|uniref:Uncharacterized protein n=1 Tax=Cyclobacterium qasimii M12-11B TaxID=641524 RepID=S7VAB7_9BACT|nr:hypothetical protein ADICYQ_4147 [Cyclobacterium qasimii M12-11B]
MVRVGSMVLTIEKIYLLGLNKNKKIIIDVLFQIAQSS